MRVLAAAVLLATLALGRPAGAWTDARPAGLVTELQIERDGGATVTLRMRWRILAGRFRAFEIAELPADFTLLEATASDATGNTVMVNTRTAATNRLEIALGENQGLPRGAIDIVVRYTTSLRAQGMVHRVGDDAIVDVSTVPWERGLEAAEIRVALPSSVRRAQWIADETPGVDSTVTSELGRDVVHAIRRHIPAGGRWTGHIACDPSLFAWLDRPTNAPLLARREDHRALFPIIATALALALGVASASVLLGRRVRTEDAGTLLVRSRYAPQIATALAALGGALQSFVRLEVPGVVTAGSMLVLASFVVIAPRAAAVRFADASVPSRLWPDARAQATARDGRSRAAGWLSMVLTALAAIAGALALRYRDLVAGVVAVDLACIAFGAWIALRRLTPRRDAALLARTAKSLARRLRKSKTARVAWRVRGDGTLPGSVALRVVPRPGHRLARGVRAIECSIAWHAGAVSWHPIEIATVRVEAGSLLEKSLRLLATRVGWIETSRDGDEIAWIAEMLGPDRSVVLAALDSLVAEAVTPAPGAGAEVRAKAMLAEVEAHA
jgi:hypothetical protein